MLRSIAPAALVLAASSPAPPQDIEWATSYEDALEAARADDRVVFVAVNMDDERGNDRMVDEVYGARAIVALSEQTVNLIGSANLHENDGRCPRFGCATCAVHRDAEKAIRSKVLGVGPSQGIVAPQHAFLSPQGEVLLSVKYAIDASELEWCFHEAIAIAGGVAPEDREHPGRRPRRLVVGGVEDAEGEESPITRDEALALIERHRKGANAAELEPMMSRLVTADEAEAREYTLKVLKSGSTGRSGGKSGKRDLDEARGRLLRQIGETSPPSYWEVCMEFADDGAESVRAEAVAALEQLAATDSLPAMMKALRRASSDEAAQGRWLRAIGATAEGDSKARGALLKASIDRKDPQLRAHALMSLGWLDPHEDVQQRLREAALPEVYGKKSKIKPGKVREVERVGALVSIGVTRSRAWRGLLKDILDDSGETKRIKRAAEAALAVIEGAPYGKLKNFVKIAGGDEIPRRRLYAGRE